MLTPPGFTEEEWSDLAERRGDHLRKSIAAARSAMGARNDVSRLLARLTAIESEAESVMPISQLRSQEQAALRQEYVVARRTLQSAESTVLALDKAAKQIELDMNGEVGTSGLLLPTFD